MADTPADQPDPADPASRELVTHGRIDVEGRLVDASNVTLFCAIELDGVTGRVVYKPVSGERPLWDFPDGTLAGREVATAIISEARPASARSRRPCCATARSAPAWSSCGSRPPRTTSSRSAPPEDLPDDWRVVLHAHDRLGEPAVLAHADHPGLRDLAVLDIVVNNTDRKGGHLLPGLDGRVYGVDHGICLHTDPKLRTVLWGWIGEPVPPDTVEKLRKLRSEIDGDLGRTLAEHITKFEIRALAERTDFLLAEGIFPEPGDDWRAIPWPLF